MDNETLRLHAMLPSTRRRWDRARDRATTHLSTATSTYVSWSGGKDSTVIAHLSTSIDPTVPLVRRTRGVDFPEVIEHCATLAAAHHWTYRVAVGGTAADYTSVISPTDEMAGYVDHRAEAEQALGHPVDGCLYGLRRDESRTRHLLLITTRGAWQAKDGTHMSAPIWDWTDLDVYAYHLHHDLPLCPVYARLAALGAPQGAWRVGYMVGGGGARRGRYGWLRRGWPDQWAQLAEQVPWLRDVS